MVGRPRKSEALPSFDEIALLAESFLRETAQSPGIISYRPHNSQLKFHTSEHKEKLYIGGNRSGKTVATVTEAVMRLIGEHPYREIPDPPIRGRGVAVDIEDGIKKIILPELAKWVPRKYLINDSWEDSYDKQSRTLSLNNRSFLELMSYEQDVEKFAGTSRHFTFFDEEPPEDIFNECLMRLVDTDGDYWISMTPLIEMTWIKSRIYDPWAKGDDSIYVLEVNTEENPHISVQALDRITRGLSEEEQEARRSGKFITHTGLVYGTSFSPKDYTDGGNVIHDIVDHHFYEYTRNWSHFACMDHGYANPAVFLFGCFDSDGRIIIYDELYETRKIVKEMAQLYLQRIEMLGVRPVYCVGDPSIRNTNAITRTSIQTEYMEHGIPIALGHNDVRAGIARVQNRFKENLLFVTRRCEETLKEIANYRWGRFASSKIEARSNKKETPLKKNDHCMDALRYGIMSRPALPDEPDIPVGNYLQAPLAGPIEYDLELMFSTPSSQDSMLGIEW